MKKYGYEDFKTYYRETANKKYRKAETQRAAIDKYLDMLGEQRDYMSLDIIEKIAAALVDDQDGSGLEFVLRDVMRLHDHDKRQPNNTKLNLLLQIVIGMMY